jgi:hypothetical protein
MNISSTKSRGTIEVCMMWFSQPAFIKPQSTILVYNYNLEFLPGKNVSRATGKTNSRSMAHKVQKVLATNCQKL